MLMSALVMMQMIAIPMRCATTLMGPTLVTVLVGIRVMDETVLVREGIAISNCNMMLFLLITTIYLIVTL